MIPFPFRGLLVRMIVYNKINPKAYSNYYGPCVIGIRGLGLLGLGGLGCKVVWGLLFRA